MNIVYKGLDEIRPYPNNPRHNDDAVDAVAKSIREFGFKVPIIIDKDGTIIAGHTRYKASMRLGLTEVPCIIADDLTEDQVKAFRLADNKVAERATWDFDLLAIELGEISLDMSQFGFDIQLEDPADAVHVESSSLADVFGVPPFSILDTRQGYWQDRKRAWKELGIRSEFGRDENLSGASDLPDYANNGTKGIAVQTSIFDPVLCEMMYRWFCVDGGDIYDCFAGGSVRGIVASKLGYKYTGIELRQEQVDADIQNAKELVCDTKYICDDSLNADKYIEDESVDMIFSCPPYGDLERYSDDERDISNMPYSQFIDTYRRIIEIASRKLKKDSFAVFVVGDIRDSKGFYRDFISDTKRAFADCGLLLYDEFILVEQVGTGALRAKKQFSSMRKHIKTHQNVLVFYNGDPRHIRDRYGDVTYFGDEEILEYDGE